MTREERELAIDIFEDNFTVIDTHGHYTEEEECLAIDMAIQALKQEPVCIGKVEFDEDKLREIVKEQISLIAIQEPCEDAISRQAVLEGINRYIEKAQSTGAKDDFISFEELVVKALPSVKPQEPTTHGYMLVCPNCGLDVHSDFESCPRCGAKMKVGE